MKKSKFILSIGSILIIPLTACSPGVDREKPLLEPEAVYSTIETDTIAGARENSTYRQVKSLPVETPPGQVISLPIEEAKIKKIVAEGQATIFGGNVDRARTAAIRMAYAEAIGRACGTEIGHLSLIRNVKYVCDIVTSRSRGFIKDYTILRDGISENDPTRYDIVIEAVVISEGKSPEGEEKALNDFLELLGSPKILIILPEKRIATLAQDSMNLEDKEKTLVEYGKGDTKLKITQESTNSTRPANTAAPEGGQDQGDTFRSTEAALAQAFSRYGYQVITSDDLLSQGLCSREVLARAKAGVTAQAVDVAKAAGADLAFLGVLNVTKEIVKPAGVDMVMVTGEVNAKALLISTGKQIDAYHRTKRATHPSMLKAYSDCLDQVAEDIVSVLAWKIPQILTNEYRETKIFAQQVSLSQTLELKKALEKIEGVETVRISQIPTEKSPIATLTLSSGFIFVEPLEILDICSKAIGLDMKLISANKYECEFSVGQNKIP